MSDAKAPSSIGPLSKFFGKKDGQKLADFAAEIRELTDTDKAELVAGINDGSFTY